MQKGSDSSCFAAMLRRSVKGSLIFMAVVLCWGNAAQAQQQEREWRDDFRNTARIQSFNNVVLDFTNISGADTGQVSLLTIDSTLATGSDFRVFLRGIEAGYIGKKAVRTVVDIDVFPANPNFYLITDAGTKSVFTYNNVQNSAGAGDIGFQIDLAFTPADAFSFVENGRPQVIITGFDDADGAGHVVKYDLEGGPTIVWEYNAISDALKLLRPSDAVVIPNQLNKIIICDTGNDRLIEADVTIPNSDAGLRVLTGESFRSPVDVEVDQNRPNVYLVTDQGNHRVVLVQRSGDTLTRIFQFGTGVAGNSNTTLTRPNDADILDNDNILISDAGNNRLIEVTPAGSIFFRFESPLPSLTDADRIADNRTLVAYRSNGSDVTPQKLAYVTKDSIISRIFSFGRAVDFDSLYWFGEDFNTPGRDGTRIRLRMRSSNSRSDILTRPFYGPTSQSSSYDLRSNAINPIHEQNGDSLFQFQVSLETSGPLRTPVLTGIRATSHFIRFEDPGTVVSTVISDSANKVVTDWRLLAFPTKGQFVTVDILDAQNNAVLASFNETENSVTSLSARAPALRGKQALRLRATLRTNSPFMMANTPVLESWRIGYTVMDTGPSRTSFTDAQFNPTDVFKLANAPSDSVFISVNDPTLAPTAGIRDTVRVMLRSTLTQDSVSVLLRVNPTNFAEFRGGLPAAFDTVARTNDSLEVQDRDVLMVSYVDPLDPADISGDTAMVVQRSFAQLRIENISGASIDSTEVSGLIYLRVTGETDQNLSAAAVDSIQAVLISRLGGEQEVVTLHEIAANAGEFRTRIGILVTDVPTANGDSRLRVSAGDDVYASYTDPFAGDVAADTIAVRGGGPPVNPLSEPFALDVAPNPFVSSQGHQLLRLQARVRSGNMSIQRVEIYNLASDLVTTIPSGQVLFNGRSTIAATDGAVITDGWWNRRSDNGAAVASGTYFVKFFVRLTGQPQGRDGETSVIRKLVIIQ